MPYLFSSESVSPGHPDKVCDQISDAFLDAVLAQDPHSRVACETLVKTGMVMLAGEVTTNAWVDTDQLVRDVLHSIGYENNIYGFSANHVAVLSTLTQQSPDIAQGVSNTNKHLQGAGDQGLMFGYACNETTTYMPAGIALAHALMHAQTQAFHTKRIPWLGPDAKAQVTVVYDEGHQPMAIDNVVLSTQHHDGVPQQELHQAIMEYIITPVIPKHLITRDTQYWINPTGRFVLGGPAADCGLTGRKIIVDTYGGMARHGGGCFSGKDPSKVDRSAAYAARWIAKHVVAAGLATRCEVQLAYAIGKHQPTSIRIDTFGTHTCNPEAIEHAIGERFDLSPYGIAESLDLLNTLYRPTATFGHVGRNDIALPWEQLDARRIKALSDLTSTQTASHHPLDIVWQRN